MANGFQSPDRDSFTSHSRLPRLSPVTFCFNRLTAIRSLRTLLFAWSSLPPDLFQSPDRDSFTSHHSGTHFKLAMYVFQSPDRDSFTSHFTRVYRCKRTSNGFNRLTAIRSLRTILLLHYPYKRTWFQSPDRDSFTSHLPISTVPVGEWIVSIA